LIILLATTLSPLGLTFSNSMLSLLAIQYFPILSYLLLDEPLNNENKGFLVFVVFVNFQLNVLTQYQKPQVCVVQNF
jgi:hypothetical protein